MDIEILYVAGCPNLALARARLAEALERSGATASVRESRVDTADDAARAGMAGSPTVLMNGRDAFATSESPSLSCRLYTTPAGIEGSPTVEQFLAVISS